MDIKQRLTQVVENTLGITFTTAEVRGLCRDALARIKVLELLAPDAEGHLPCPPDCVFKDAPHIHATGVIGKNNPPR